MIKRREQISTLPSSENSSTLQFLETEKIRLEKIKYLIEHKSVLSNSQEEGFHQKKKENRNQLKRKIIKEMSQKKSIFQQNMMDFFNKLF